MKDKIEKHGSSAVGAAIFGYFTASGFDQAEVQSVLDALAKADLKQILIGAVLFFLLYRHKDKA